MVQAFTSNRHHDAGKDSAKDMSAVNGLRRHLRSPLFQFFGHDDLELKRGIDQKH
jgi:hypothetical protein